MGESEGRFACIFDMDGTLVDSEPNYFEADRIFLAGYGIAYDECFRDSMIGRGNLAFFSVIEEEWPDNAVNRLPMEERLFLKDENYLEYARGRTFAFPKMVELVRLLRESGYPLAVASGSSPEIIRKSLEFSGLLEAFALLLSASEVPRGKPEPDIFLEGAKRMGREPSECVVLEDSRYGVLAALAAGMKVIGIPSVLSKPLPEPFSRVDLLFEGGMEEFDARRAFRFIGSLKP
jgi:HAD superfamily hydrolase (TIGR01509 family)